MLRPSPPPRRSVSATSTQSCKRQACHASSSTSTYRLCTFFASSSAPILLRRHVVLIHRYRHTQISRRAKMRPHTEFITHGHRHRHGHGHGHTQTHAQIHTDIHRHTRTETHTKRAPAKNEFLSVFPHAPKHTCRPADHGSSLAFVLRGPQGGRLLSLSTSMF